MTIKVRDPKRWSRLPMGDIIGLDGEGLRPVRLEINAAAHAQFDLRYPDDTVKFLAAFQGIETISFLADGPVEVWVTSESDVYFYTDEGRNVAYVDDGKVVFTKPHQRRGPSEQIIYMQGLMLQNMTRRNAQLEAYRLAAEAKESENAELIRVDPPVVPPSAGEPVVEPPANP